MQTLKFFQKASLTLMALNLSFTGGKAVAGSFSGSTFDPGKIDSAIAGFVGSDGLGVVSPNNTVNPIFTSWATGFINYRPAPGGGHIDSRCARELTRFKELKVYAY